MQIREIVLYNAAGEIRRLRFRTGEVNIISGGSQTGKSALIGIVEYCLGLDPCPVPKGVIRDTVAWYGLLLQFPDTQCFIARRDPGPFKKSSSDIYLEVGEGLEPPPFNALKQTATKDSLIDFLTRKSGITPNLHEPPDRSTRRPLEANIKHALFLVFQRQDEIAKPTMLFHRQDEEFVPQSIRDTLPYFLGAVNEDRLAARQELRRLRLEQRNLERQEQEARVLREGTLPLAAALLEEARAVALADAAASTDGQGLMLTRASLQAALERDPSASEQGEAIADELRQLREDRSRLLGRQRQLRDRVDAARGLLHEQGGFVHEVEIQRARLQSVDLLGGPYADIRNCPVCESSLEAPAPGADLLRRSLEQLSVQLENVEDARPRLDEYIGGVEEEVASLHEQLRQNQVSINALIAQDQALIARRSLDERRAFVKGRISVYLESAGVLPTDDDRIARALQAVQRQVQELESELRDETLKDVVGSILNLLSREMSGWATELNMEYARFPLRLDLAQLTVVADTPQGPVSMDEMGSGENWIGCHITAFMALHRYFVSQSRPVPRFLFLDQPTQVYYPPERDVEGRLDVLKDEDRTAVHRLFNLIFRLMREVAPELQVIITDHADLDDEVFQEAVVEKWRGGEKLVPTAWIKAASV